MVPDGLKEEILNQKINKLSTSGCCNNKNDIYECILLICNRYEIELRIYDDCPIVVVHMQYCCVSRNI